MKKSYILIALAMLAALTMTSCKNNNRKSQNQEPTQEEIQAQKQALADSVLAKIDAFAEEFIKGSESGLGISNYKLTEAERMVKPDYLLDPSEVNKLVTKSQKINALAMYMADLEIMELYGMPVNETKEAVAKLTIDLNHPLDYDKYDKETPISLKIKDLYVKCKENGELSYFWQFQQAGIFEISYLIANNPDFFFDRITEEQWQSFNREVKALVFARAELAKYDEEMAEMNDYMVHNNVFAGMSNEEKSKVNATRESAKQFRIDNKDKYIAIRNSLLQ